MSLQPLYPFSEQEKFKVLTNMHSFVLAKMKHSSYPVRVYGNALELWINIYYIAPKGFTADRLIVTIGEIGKQMDVYKVDNYKSVYEKATGTGTKSSVLMMSAGAHFSKANYSYAAVKFQYNGCYKYEKLDENALKKL